MRAPALLVPLSLFLLAAACGEAPPPPEEAVPPTPDGVDATTLDYADELGIDFDAMDRTPSGVYYRDHVVGDGGEAEAGRTAVVHYTGYFPDGRIFDSSRDRDQPFPVDLGAGQVIAGWEDGVPGMRVGGQRTLVIPPELAYGPAGRGGIPPNAVLVFEVELLEVH